MKILYTHENLTNRLAGFSMASFFREVAKHCEFKAVGFEQPDNIKELNRKLLEECKKLSKKFAPIEPRYGLTSYQISCHRLSMLYLLKLHYGDDDPDWVLGDGRIHASEINRNYKLCRWIGDVHVNTALVTRIANEELDAIALRSLHSTYAFQTVEKFRGCFGKKIEQWIEEGNVDVLEDDYFIKRLKNCTPFFWPISYEPTYFKPSAIKKYDVSMIGTVGGFYPLRKAIWNELPSLAKENGWKTIIQKPPSMKYVKERKDTRLIYNNPEYRKRWLVREDYARAVAESKIFIFGSSIFKYPVGKYAQAMLSKTLVMADKPFHAEDLGFKAGWNFVQINESTWKEKLQYYLIHDREREAIAQRGYENALKKLTNKVVAKNFLDDLSRIKRLR